MHGENERYALSFTSGGLLVREGPLAASIYSEMRDWDSVRRGLTSDNLLQARTATSSARLVRETVQRLAVLDAEELELLVDGSPSERGLLMWIAACRRYAFIGEFAEEVVRERFLLLTPTLSYGDFDSFVAEKSLWHPELHELKSSTLTKLRATLFRMLSEAELLVEGHIQPVVLSERVRDALDAQTPSDIRFLPTRDSKEGAL